MHTSGGTPPPHAYTELAQNSRGGKPWKLTVKKLIDNEMFFFHRLCPLQTVKNRRKPWKNRHQTVKKSVPKIHHFFTVSFSPFTSSWKISKALVFRELLPESKEKSYTPLPPPPISGQKALFRGRGGGVYILRPHAAGILYPPLLYAPHPWKGILAHRNRSDFCDLRLRCPSRTPEIARFPKQETAMMHCDSRVRWKVASDLRFRAAISEPKTLLAAGFLAIWLRQRGNR